MKKLYISLVSLAILLHLSPHMYAGAGFFGSNTGGLLAYTVNNGSMVTTNSFGNLGNCYAFALNGAYIHTWKDGSGNICSGTLRYRIYPQGSPTGGFSPVTLNWSANHSFTTNATPSNVTSSNGGDQRWGQTSANIDLLNGLTRGTAYTLEFYFEATGDAGSSSGCGQTFYESNGGSNFKIDFTPVYGTQQSGNWNSSSTWSNGNIPVSGNYPVILNHNVTLDLSTTVGNLDIQSNSLTINSGNTLTLGGTLNNGGTIVNNGKIVITGTSTFPGSSTTISAMNDLEINRSAGVTLDKDITISGTLTLTSGKLNAGNNTVIIGNAGAIAGGSSSNYITGKLQINNVTTSRTFPVGNSTYNPAIIVNTGTADNFTVSVGDFITSDGTSGGSAVTTNAVQRTWSITEGSAGGSNVTLTLQWNTGEELGTFNTERGNNNIYISHYTGGGWNAGTAGAASGAGPFTISRSGITSFSPFGIGGGGALPVTLIDFSASLNLMSRAELSWKTGSEINASHFWVYRARANGNKELIGTIQAAGNSNEINNYLFTDPQPVSAKTYYLLEQVDFDGKTEWFGPVSVEISSQNKITLFPLPATEVIHVNGSFTNDEPVLLTLTDISGKSVIQKIIAAGNPVSFEVTGLARGTYLVKTQQGNNQFVTKLIF